MNKIGILVILVFLAGIVFAFAQENITITTYYPSPSGTYDELRVHTRASMGTGLLTTPLHVAGNPTDPVGGVCPSDFRWYDEDGDSIIDNGECKLPILTVGAGSTGIVGVGTRLPNAAAKFQVAGDSTNPVGGMCPTGYDWYDENLNTVIDNSECKLTPLTVTYDGKVGIGINAPLATLDVRGGFYLGGGSGDITGDGVVTGVDNTKIVNYLGGSSSLTPEEYANADVNGDGIVNALDRDLILKLIGHTMTRDQAEEKGKYVAGTAITPTYSGNVGIGTTSPLSKLDVMNSTWIAQNSGASAGLRILAADAGGIAAAAIDAVSRDASGNDTGFYGLLIRAAVISLWNANSDKMILSQEGDVSMGTVTQGNPSPIPVSPVNNEHGNLFINDVYLRSKSKWVSQISGGGMATTYVKMLSGSNPKVKCNGNDVATGGGFYVTSSTKIYQSYPTDSSGNKINSGTPHGWACLGDISVYCYVVCAQ